jgi:hypothetical protein
MIQWDGMRMPMMQPNQFENAEQMRMTLLQAVTGNQYIRPIIEEEHHAQEILDSKYEQQDLKKVADEQIHLSKKQRDLLYEFLFRDHKELFSGKLGVWPHEKISVQIKPKAVPYHCKRPIRIPHIHMETLKKEVDRLVSIGVLKVVDGAKAGPWCAPSFIIPKKDGRVRFITDFRQLNKWIQRRPWPMPHISDLIQDIGRYKYVTAVDLSMGYYHFELDEELSEMTTFMLPWGLYKYC